MNMSTRLRERWRSAAILAAALLFAMPSPGAAHVGPPHDARLRLVEAGPGNPALPARAPAGERLWRVAEGRPSAAAIQTARKRKGLPAAARAIGWRLVDRGGGKAWKIIFRVGNRQVAVEVPAGR